MSWWNPLTWNPAQQIAEFVWGNPILGGEGFLGVATDTAIAAAINDPTGTHPVGAIGSAALDPITPDWLFTPRAGLDAGGGFSGNQGKTGWLPEGLVPDAWEGPLRVGALAVAAIGIALLLRD